MVPPKRALTLQRLGFTIVHDVLFPMTINDGTRREEYDLVKLCAVNIVDLPASTRG